MEDYYLGIKKDFTVVVPVYNSEYGLEELFNRIILTLSNYSQNFEIILVDDCSKDNSWMVIKKIKNSYPRLVKGIRLSKNYGQHNATICGIKHSDSEFIITVDDDFEHKPEDISKLIEKYNIEKADVIYGVNVKNKGNWIRRTLTHFFRIIQQLFGKTNVKKGSSFRLIKGEIAKKIVENAREFSFIDEFLLWYTASISTVMVNTGKPVVQSRYKTPGLIDLTKNLVYLSSSIPLKVTTSFGFLMMLVNFIAGIVIIYKRIILSIDVKGYTSIIVTILFSSGVIIFCLGIVAEYIGKILMMNYKKPSYFESEII